MLKCRSFFITIVLMITAAFILSSCVGNEGSQNAVDDSKALVPVTTDEAEKPSATPVTGETGTKAAEAEPAKTPEIKQEDAPKVINIDNNIAAFSNLPYDIRENIYENGSVKVRYPYVAGLNDENIEKKINDLIRNDAMKYSAEYSSKGSVLDVSFQIAFAGDTLLSIKYIEYSSFAQAAHPNHAFYSTNIYIPMASKIKLADMIKISGYFAEAFKKNCKYVAPHNDVSPELESALSTYINSTHGTLLQKADTEDGINECFSYFTKDSLGVSIGVPFVIGGYALYEIKYVDITSYIYHKNEMWKNFPDILSKIFSAGNDSITGNIYDFIPEGWIILEQNGEKAIKECDYDKNGNTDLVFVIEKVSDNGTTAPRTLVVARGNGDWTYTPAVEAKNAVFSADEGGIWGDPFEGIEIRNGSLYLHFYGGSSWRWEKTYQFRYQDGDWYLIGATDSFINISTNEGTVKDYNLLTGDYIIKETSKDGKVDEKKGNFNKRYKYNLSGFDVRNEDVFSF